MTRLFFASIAIALFGLGSVSAQSTRQNDSAPMASPGAGDTASGQTVDEGTLMERRLAASGRTHGSYRAASAHISSAHRALRHHARASRERTRHGRHHGRTARGHSGHHHAKHARSERHHSSHGNKAQGRVTNAKAHAHKGSRRRHHR